MTISSPAAKPAVSRAEQEEKDRRERANTDAIAEASKDTEELTQDQIRQRNTMNAQFQDVLGSNPLFKMLYQIFGGLKGQGAGGGINDISNSFFDKIVRDVATVTADEKQAGYVDVRNAADMSNNLKLALQEKFNKGQLTFGNTPEENKAGFQQLLAEVDDVVKAGQQGRTSFNPGLIAQEMTQRIKEFDGAIKIQPEFPAPQAKVLGENLEYGKKVEITPDVLDKAGFRNSLQLYQLNPEGHLDMTESARPKGLNAALGGGKITLEIVEQDGNRIGYFASNDKGEGYYLDPAAIKLDKMDPAMKKALTEPAPQIAQPQQPQPQRELDDENAPIGAIMPVSSMTMRPTG